MKKPRPIKHIGRKRRVLGWTLLTLGMLVAGVWVWSGWRYLGWHSRSGYEFNLQAGELTVIRRAFDASRSRGWSWGLSDSSVRPSFTGRTRGEWAFNEYMRGSSASRTDLYLAEWTLVPRQMDVWKFVLWPLPLLLWTPAALLLRSGIVARRRALTGKCKTCGYDLAGLGAEAKCPECGGGGKGGGTK